jgi:hypothetical protein
VLIKGVRFDGIDITLKRFLGDLRGRLGRRVFAFGQAVDFARLQPADNRFGKRKKKRQRGAVGYV